MRTQKLIQFIIIAVYFVYGYSKQFYLHFMNINFKHFSDKCLPEKCDFQKKNSIRLRRIKPCGLALCRSSLTPFSQTSIAQKKSDSYIELGGKHRAEARIGVGTRGVAVDAKGNTTAVGDDVPTATTNDAVITR